MGTMSLGIERMRAWPSTLALDLPALARARGVDPAATLDHLLVQERSVMPPWEDAVTMAANAAAPMLEGIDRESIELLIVGTETPVDLEKPASSWLQRLLGLPSRCRNFEIKHACYSVTAAMRMALAWLGTPQGRGKRALVVGTDASYQGLGAPWEYVLGAGSMALLLSDQPDALEIDPLAGVYASEVTDVIRPTRRIETGSSEASLLAYLEAVDETLDAYEALTGPLEDLDHLVYHAPFAGITFRAHRRLLERNGGLPRAEAWADFERRSLPGLCFHRRTGGVYGSSTALSMLGALASRPDLRPGSTMGVFSFGSGSCAEFYTARVGPHATAVVERSEASALLDARYSIDVPTYEALERERDESPTRPDYAPSRDILRQHYAQTWEGRGLCALTSVSDWERSYAWT